MGSESETRPRTVSKVTRQVVKIKPLLEQDDTGIKDAQWMNEF